MFGLRLTCLLSLYNMDSCSDFEDYDICFERCYNDKLSLLRTQNSVKDERIKLLQETLDLLHLKDRKQKKLIVQLKSKISKISEFLKIG